MKKAVVFLMAFCMSAHLFSQRNDNAEYWNTWRYTAKEGMQQKFEEAAAKKTAMFNTTPETAIVTYRFITGPNSGTYMRIEARKSPADYDKDRSAEGNYWRDNVSKYAANNGGQVRWQLLNGGTINYDPENPAPPAKFVRMVTFNVKADGVRAFRRWMYRASKVIEKRGNKNPRMLFRLESGGNRNQFVLALPYESHKRTDPPRENENTWREDYNELFGWGTFEEDGENIDASFEFWGEQVETLQLVPAMSTKM
ncbi:hypothetical protein [Muriicola sp.]|uniref:hypothetical protein n=2 Tax=Muriicola sp. TaxID=2020856 RepID=UPI00356A07D8